MIKHFFYSMILTFLSCTLYATMVPQSGDPLTVSHIAVTVPSKRLSDSLTLDPLSSIAVLSSHGESSSPEDQQKYGAVRLKKTRKKKGINRLNHAIGTLQQPQKQEMFSLQQPVPFWQQQLQKHIAGVAAYQKQQKEAVSIGFLKIRLPLFQGKEVDCLIKQKWLHSEKEYSECGEEIPKYSGYYALFYALSKVLPEETQFAQGKDQFLGILMEYIEESRKELKQVLGNLGTVTAKELERILELLIMQKPFLGKHIGIVKASFPFVVCIMADRMDAGYKKIFMVNIATELEPHWIAFSFEKKSSELVEVELYDSLNISRGEMLIGAQK